MMSRRDLLARINASLHEFTRTQNEAYVVDPQVRSHAEQLMQTIVRSSSANYGSEIDLECMHAIGWLHWLRYLHLDDPDGAEDLQRAVAVLGPVYRAKPDAVPEPLREYFSETEARVGEQERRTDAFRADIDASRDQPGHATRLSALSAALQLKFDQTAAMQVLEESITVARQSVEASAAVPTERVGCLTTLVNALWRRFERTGDTQALLEAVDVGREAANIAGSDDPDRPPALAMLGAVLKRQFDVTGQLHILIDSVNYLQEAAAETSEEYPERGAVLSNLGIASRVLYERTGTVDALQAAKRAGRAAIDTSPTDHFDYAMYLSNLSIALQQDFDRVGDIELLDEALSLGREAIVAVRPSHPQLADILGTHAGSLRRLFRWTGDTGVLNEAIATYRIAVSSSPSYPDRSMHLANLASSLWALYQETKNRPYLDEAAELQRRAVLETPQESQRRAGFYSILSQILAELFEVTQELTHLEEAIVAAREAVAATELESHAGRIVWASLAGALRVKYGHTNDLSSLDEAISLLRRIVQYESADSHAASHLLDLGNALWSKYKIVRDPQLLQEAHHALTTATAQVAAPMEVQVSAYRALARLEGDRRDWVAAAAAYGAAVERLPRLAGRHLRRSDRERLLARFGELVSDAAACAIETGDGVRALEILEQGRNVLLSQVLDTHGDLADLAVCAPNLADKFETIRRSLSEFELLDPDLLLRQLAGPVVQQPMATRRHELWNEWDRLLEEIRMEPGFERFLRPLDRGELLSAGELGAVVTVNISQYRCDALVIMRGEVAVVPLPELNSRTARIQAASFLSALGVMQGASSTAEHARAAKDAILYALGWLWDTCVSQVLHHLGLTEPVSQDQDHRVWWSATGVLKFLPLHAAGNYNQMGGSGTPTVAMDRSLAHMFRLFDPYCIVARNCSRNDSACSS